MEPVLAPGSSILAELHEKHKERQERIKSAALKTLTSGGISIPPNSFDIILEGVCEHCKVRKEDILSPRRFGFIAEKRHLLAYMMYWLTDYSMPQIAKRMQRDHTTVLHSINKISSHLALHRGDIEEMEKKIKPMLPQKRK